MVVSVVCDLAEWSASLTLNAYAPELKQEKLVEERGTSGKRAPQSLTGDPGFLMPILAILPGTTITGNAANRQAFQGSNGPYKPRSRY
jgi:hypothetical protein